MDKRNLLHMTIYCSAMSPCGKYLAVGDNYGHIILFNIASAVLPASSDLHQKPSFIFKAHAGPIHALHATPKFLISAGCGPIVGWKWDDMINKKPTKSWTLSTEQDDKDSSESYNCLSYNTKDNILYTGGDNSTAMMWDIKSGTCVESFIGHDDYIHDIDLLSSNFVTASEDGTVKIWDARTNYCTNTITPHKNPQLSRPEVGNWVSCVATDSNGQWLACGGGSKTSLWHLRSNTLVSTLDVPGSTKFKNPGFVANVITFYENEIVAAGNGSNLHRWHANGDSKAVIPCSISNIFSIAFKSSHHKENQKLPMFVTGNSFSINIFTNLGYLGMSLSVC